MSSDEQGPLGIDGIICLERGRGGLRRVVVITDAAAGEVYLHGAHVTHYQPRSVEHPVLFLSSESRFEPGEPIRGGVPICFPWFGPKAGDANAPMHGFARTREWSLVSTKRIDDRSAAVTLELRSDDETRRQWPHDFVARYMVTVGPVLEMALEVTNTSRGGPFTFQEALHTYFSVADARQVSISGLQNTRYFDKVAEAEETQGAEPIRFTGETDRVYQDTTTNCVIDDPVWRRRLITEKAGSRTTVVWNPWIEKAKQLPDFGDEEWRSMACVETANAGSTPVVLNPGESHVIRAIVRVEGR
jgi:glucose-6-phosphate 1-epimerase